MYLLEHRPGGQAFSGVVLHDGRVRPVPIVLERDLDPLPGKANENGHQRKHNSKILSTKGSLPVRRGHWQIHQGAQVYQLSAFSSCCR